MQMVTCWNGSSRSPTLKYFMVDFDISTPLPHLGSTHRTTASQDSVCLPFSVTNSQCQFGINLQDGTPLPQQPPQAHLHPPLPIPSSPLLSTQKIPKMYLPS